MSCWSWSLVLSGRWEWWLIINECCDTVCKWCVIYYILISNTNDSFNFMCFERVWIYICWFCPIWPLWSDDLHTWNGISILSAPNLVRLRLSPLELIAWNEWNRRKKLDVFTSFRSKVENQASFCFIIIAFNCFKKHSLEIRWIWEKKKTTARNRQIDK